MLSYILVKLLERNEISTNLYNKVANPASVVDGFIIFGLLFLVFKKIM